MVISTLSEHHEPNARVIDIFYIDDDHLYFVTFEGKPFFRELQRNARIAITTMGEEWIQVRMKATIKIHDKEEKERFIKQHPTLKERFMHDQLQLIEVIEGEGEAFDINGDVAFLQRGRFTFHSKTVHQAGYVITDRCVTCDSCYQHCPFDAIERGDDRYHIIPQRCNECGICQSVCPVDAINESLGL